MPFFSAKFRVDKCAHQLQGNRRPDDTSAHDQYVEVVVLNSLVRGIVVMTQTSTNAWNFIGRHSRSNAAAADQDAALGLAIPHRYSYSFGKVRVIHWLGVVCAKIKHLML